MGQYFRVYNLTNNNSAATIPSTINFGLPWVKNLHKYDEEDQISIFKDIIKDNNWKETDKLKAKGDYGDVVSYENGKLSNSFEEEAEDYEVSE